MLVQIQEHVPFVSTISYLAALYYFDLCCSPGPVNSSFTIYNCILYLFKDTFYLFITYFITHNLKVIWG